mmetsp:Transcript_5726/g.18302  ORF Transcript_5726/g.18302 Transcript_5726/m.18302 type:complete len:262 (-) Transcript_5726:506-1291(-)
MTSLRGEAASPAGSSCRSPIGGCNAVDPDKADEVVVEVVVGTSRFSSARSASSSACGKAQSLSASMPRNAVAPHTRRTHSVPFWRIPRSVPAPYRVRTTRKSRTTIPRQCSSSSAVSAADSPGRDGRRAPPRASTSGSASSSWRARSDAEAETWSSSRRSAASEPAEGASSPGGSAGASPSLSRSKAFSVVSSSQRERSCEMLCSAVSASVRAPCTAASRRPKASRRALKRPWIASSTWRCSSCLTRSICIFSTKAWRMEW